MQTVLNAINDLPGASADGSDDADAGWRLNHDNRDLVTRVQACVDRVNDRQKAVPCAHWFVRHLPGGADKVMAAQLCSQLTCEWYQQTESEEAEQVISL